LNISLSEMRYQDLVNFLRFVYEGEITLSQRRSSVLQKWLKILGVHLTLSQTPVSVQDSESLTQVLKFSSQSNLATKGVESPFQTFQKVPNKWYFILISSTVG
jgi:hypothetical protein